MKPFLTILGTIAITALVACDQANQDTIPVSANAAVQTLIEIKTSEQSHTDPTEFYNSEYCVGKDGELIEFNLEACSPLTRIVCNVNASAKTKGAILPAGSTQKISGIRRIYGYDAWEQKSYSQIYIDVAHNESSPEAKITSISCGSKGVTAEPIDLATAELLLKKLVVITR